MEYLHIILIILISFGTPGQGVNTCVKNGQDTVCLHRTSGNKYAANATIYTFGYPLEILNETMTTFLSEKILGLDDDLFAVYWISLSKQNSSYRYMWESSGATTEGYSNWASGATQSEDCVVLSGADQTWYDKECSFAADGFIYVKSKEATATSGPAIVLATLPVNTADTTYYMGTTLTTNHPTAPPSEGSTGETSTSNDASTARETGVHTTSHSTTTTAHPGLSTTPAHQETGVHTTSHSTTTTAHPGLSTTVAQQGTSECGSNCETIRSTLPWLPIAERLNEASVGKVNSLVQRENLTSDDVLLVQQWFEKNNELTGDVEDAYQYTKKYLDTFDKIITSSNEDTFQSANPAVFADACNHILEQFAQMSDDNLTRISLPSIEAELVESTVESFTGYSSNFKREEQNKSKNYIAIQNDWVKDYKDDSDAANIEIIGTLYNTSHIEKFGNDDDNEIVSSMVSLTVLVDGEVTSLPVEFGLALNPMDTGRRVPKDGFKIERNPSCVFWDPFGDKDSGLWRPGGCEVVEQSTSYVKCFCKHTTNFAILMQTTEIEISEAHESALSTLSLIGLGVSTVALILTILILICLPSLKSDRVFIHKHLVVALIIAQSLFISTVGAANHELSCKLVAIFLHYFYLAVFMWMLIEGVHLYLEIVQVFSRFDGKKKTVHYIIGGWGIPLIIVGVSVGIRWQNYGIGPGCWLSFDDGLIWAFLGPVCLVIVTNFIILLMVVRVVFRASSARGKEESEYKHLTAALKGALFLLPLLGLTWVIGLMSVSKGTLVFQYLFVVLNSLQGLFIFLFYCAMNKEVRGALSRRFSRAALESGDSRSISLRAVAMLKTSKNTDTSPVIRFNDTSNDTSGIHSLDSRMMDENDPVSASGIRVHPRKSESQQNLTQGDGNRSPFSPDYD